MLDYLLQHEGAVYAGCYTASIAIVAFWEGIRPRRTLTQPMGLRWSNNILVTLLDVMLVRLTFPLIGITFAIYVANQGWGILHLIQLPPLAAALIALMLLDLGTYIQHFLLHKPLLWRLHLMHHSDLDYDFSTGLRFHPLEAVFTTVFDLLIIVIIGPPAAVYLFYKLIHTVMAAFAHGNIHLPDAVDRQLRKFIVTPDIHRIHHSATEGETNSNFGGITPWWDRLFGTYIDQPSLGHSRMIVGLPLFRESKHLYLPWMLAQPFMNHKTEQHDLKQIETLHH